MYPDTNELTTRLQREAARLANQLEAEPPLERLFAEHARRRNVRRVTLAGGIAACGLLAAALLYWSDPSGDEVVVVQRSNGNALPMHDTRSLAQTGAIAGDASPVSSAIPVQEQMAGLSLPDGAVPFLIVEPDGTGSNR